MIEFRLTLTDGTHEKVKFKNDEINGVLMSVINSNDLFDKTGWDDKNRLKDIKYVHIRAYKLAMCGVDIADLRGLEHIEFKGNINGFFKLVLPLFHKYKVVNAPTNLLSIFCSPYATITNMDELLESHMTLRMVAHSAKEDGFEDGH